jgi:alpha-galactosidase
VVDYLVGDLGVGYLKLDYNFAVGPGPDTGGLTAGAGLLDANRAHLGWLDAVLDRHPGLVIENCSSGGMRTDYALLSRVQLQSTSDQQDYLRYPPIAAAAPAAIAPEQAAVWSYPQPEFTNDEIAFTMASAMLGRVAIPQSTAFWPLGLPRWDAPWVALGLRGPHTPGRPGARAVSLLTVWRRGPEPDDKTGQITFPMPHLRGAAVTAEVLYPRHAGARASWNATDDTLTMRLPGLPSACVVRLAGSAAR